MRPIISIKVKGPSRTIKYEVLVDSGADACIFHAELGELLGIDVENGRSGTLSGISGKEAQYFLHDVEVQLGKFKTKIEVGFFSGISTHSAPYGVVGHKNFFEFFKITFDTKKENLKLVVNK